MGGSGGREIRIKEGQLARLAALPRHYTSVDICRLRNRESRQERILPYNGRIAIVQDPKRQGKYKSGVLRIDPSNPEFFSLQDEVDITTFAYDDVKVVLVEG